MTENIEKNLKELEDMYNAGIIDAQTYKEMKEQVTGIVEFESAPAPVSSPPPVITAAFEIPKYHISVNGVNRGIFERDVIINEIRSGNFKKNNLVWMDGMPKWVKLGEMPAFEDCFVTAAPSAPPSNSTAPPSISTVPIQQTASSDDKTEYGNTCGNLKNKGIAALKDGWIYYLGGKTGHYTGQIFKMRTDGTKKQILEKSNDCCSINVVGDWVFYIKGNRIYKMHTDGTQQQEFYYTDGCFTVAEEWVYLSEFGKSHIYKIRTDGTKGQKINDTSLDFQLSDGWLYYRDRFADSDEYNLYRIRTDGTQKQIISNDYIKEFITTSEWIFYRSPSIGGVYKMRTDGTQKQKLCDDSCGGINADCDWVYYYYYSSGGKIFKMRTDGTQKQKIFDDDCLFINIAGDWLYYYNGNKNKFFKIRTDGTDKEAIR